ARDLSGLRDHISEASSGGVGLVASPARRRVRPTWILGTVALIVAAGLLGWWVARGRAVSIPSVPTFRRLSFQSGTIGNARFTPSGDVIYGLRPTGSQPGAKLLLTRLESPESKTFEFQADIFSISKSGDLAIYQMGSPGSVSGTLSVVPLV